MSKDLGASAKAETGSRASMEPVPVSTLSGFDPARCALTYALALIAEECAEATQFVGKALRFGFDTPGAPETPFNGDTARDNLPKELGDIRAAIHSIGEQQSVGDDALFQWLDANRSLEVSWTEVDGDLSECAWHVHRRFGGINDREWKLIATGDTFLEALKAARAALPPPPEGEQR